MHFQMVQGGRFRLDNTIIINLNFVDQKSRVPKSNTT